MSASLVGSEMCIRDSAKMARTRRKALESLACGPSGSARDAGRCKWSTGPVSYTHLTLPTICSV
eukprot:14161063-Alexandrium_andersonii.AAC.1